MMVQKEETIAAERFLIILTAPLCLAVKSSKVADSSELLETLVRPNKTLIKKHQELSKRQRWAHGCTCAPPTPNTHTHTYRLAPRETTHQQRQCGQRQREAESHTQKQKEKLQFCCCLIFTGWSWLWLSSASLLGYFERRIHVSHIKSFCRPHRRNPGKIPREVNDINEELISRGVRGCNVMEGIQTSTDLEPWVSAASRGPPPPSRPWCPEGQGWTTYLTAFLCCGLFPWVHPADGCQANSPRYSAREECFLAHDSSRFLLCPPSEMLF